MTIKKIAGYVSGNGAEVDSDNNLQTSSFIKNADGNVVSLATEDTLQDIKVILEEPLSEWVSSNIDTTDATNYYFLSFITGTTKWRINRLNKTTYVSDYAIGDSDIETAWTDRASQTYAIIY